MKAYWLERMREPSTWRGLIWLLSAFGVYQFSSDQESALIAMSMALAGGGGLLPDHLTQLPFRRSQGGNHE